MNYKQIKVSHKRSPTHKRGGRQIIGTQKEKDNGSQYQYIPPFDQPKKIANNLEVTVSMSEQEKTYINVKKVLASWNETH